MNELENSGPDWGWKINKDGKHKILFDGKYILIPKKDGNLISVSLPSSVHFFTPHFLCIVYLK